MEMNISEKKTLVYLDNAATTIHKPDAVIKAVSYAMTHFGNAGHGTGEASLDAARAVFYARRTVDALFGGDGPGQVVFTANVTQALNTALFGLLKPGDHVITTVMEHNSVLRPLYKMEKEGVALSFVGVDDRGRLKYNEFEALFRRETKMVVCTHASNVTGNLNDLKRIGDFCIERDLLFVVDVAQTAGLFPISMRDLGIDVLCFTGHKSLLGPQGTGGLCVRKGIEIDPLVVGGSGVQTFLKEHPTEMPVRLEAGTLNSHGIAGLAAGIDYINECGIQTLQRKALARMWQFYEGIKDMAGVLVYGDVEDLYEQRRPGRKADLKDADVRSERSEALRAPVIALNLKGQDPAIVADDLMMNYGVMTRAGGHCAPLMHEALGNGGAGCVRFSFSHSNTETEVDAAVAALKDMI